MGRLLTVQEAAELLQVSRNTIYSQAQAENIPSIRIGRCWRFDEDALRTLIGTAAKQDQPTAVSHVQDAIPQDVKDAIVTVARWIIQTVKQKSEGFVSHTPVLEPLTSMKRQPTKRHRIQGDPRTVGRSQTYHVIEPKPKPFLSGKEVAKRLGISASKFYSMVKSGQFPTLRSKGYTEEMVEAYVEFGGRKPEEGWWPFIFRRRFDRADEQGKKRMLEDGFDPKTGQFDTQVWERK